MDQRRRSFLLLTGIAVSAVAVLNACGPKPIPRPGRPHDFVRLKIGEHAVVAEVACDDASRRLGLMNRESLADGKGMLFIFPGLERRGFWMRNTYIPLSIAFIADDGTILQIEHMKPKDETSTRSKDKVRYALEVPKGWFERSGIAVGARVESLAETVERFRVK